MVNRINSLRNYHLYEKPGNSGESSNGTVHHGGNFPENKYYISRYYLFPVYTDTTDRARLHLERERKITTQYRSSVQMVSTPFLRSSKTKALMLPCLIFNTLEWYDFYCVTLTDRVV